MAGNLIGLIITTFIVAIVYGLFVTAVDFNDPRYSPVASGHRAAHNVYGLFGTASDEIQRNESDPSPHATSTAYKIARPYAITADLSAIFGGKIALGVSTLFNSTRAPRQIGTS